MRTTVFVGTSVDGFIARKDGAVDFLEAGGEGGGESHGFMEFMATVDALVMGRNTYETVLGFGKWYYGSTPVFVLTTRGAMAIPPKATVEFLSGEPADVVAKLSARGFQHLYVDGGETIQRFLRAGLISRFIISRVPVLIGSGISLFGSVDSDVQLKHVDTKVFKGGMVQSEYEVVSAAKQR